VENDLRAKLAKLYDVAAEGTEGVENHLERQVAQLSGTAR